MNGLLGAFNEGGDSGPFLTTDFNSPAKPKIAKAIANEKFADDGDFNPLLTGKQGYDTKYWRLGGSFGNPPIDFIGPQPFDI
jgi:hypothetical protein